MKVLQFTIPVQQDKTVLARIDVLPYFYPYLHRHKETQITWVQQGDGTLVVNNNMHVFQTNDIFFINANQPHIFKSSPAYFQPKSNKIIKSLDIFFDPELVSQKLLNIFEMKNLQSFLNKSQNGFKVPQKMVALISNKMLLIKQSEDSIERIIHFIELLKILSTASLQEKLSDQISILENENEGIRISQIYNYILKHYERDISLKEVAAQAYMTPQAFCRFFKKQTRHTFVSFLNEVRINEACKLFAEGNYDNISGIAYKCGFNSITNFNRVFKAIRGSSPKSYIENLKSKITLDVPGHSIIPN